jgi:hypothetical protein
MYLRCESHMERKIICSTNQKVVDDLLTKYDGRNRAANSQAPCAKNLLNSFSAGVMQESLRANECLGCRGIDRIL